MVVRASSIVLNSSAETIPAGGSTCLKQLKENIEYTVGIHADVTEDTPIKLTAYDGGKTDAEP